MKSATDGRVEFRRLSEVSCEDLMDLMNDVRVRRHLPLATEPFDRDACARFVAAKEAHWEQHGYGPWAIYVGGAFAGWGGLQPEGGEIDVGMILRPDHWGLGHAVLERSLRFAFEELEASSVIALLPPSRKNRSALQRFGFEPDGELVVSGERFLRYRLHRPRR